MAAGVLTYTQHLMSPWQPDKPSKSPSPPTLLSAEMVRSTNYELKCHPPEVAASIRLSWGQLMVAAGPTGSCPRCRSLILPSAWLYEEGVKPHPNIFPISFSSFFVLLLYPALPLSSFPPLSFCMSDFCTPLPCSPPFLTSSSGKGLTRPSESSESYIWELITLPWRLPVCRAEKRDTETTRRRREKGSERGIWARKRIWINHTVHRTPPWRRSSTVNLISGFATVACCKSWINVPQFSPAGPGLRVIDYATLWQSARGSRLWGVAPEHSSHVLNAECFTTCSVMQIFLPFSLQGLLLNSGLTLQSSRGQNKKTQV